MNGVAKFTVDPGNSLLLSLVSFKFPNLLSFLPQIYVDRRVREFNEGTYEWSIPPAWPWRQEDLLCGEYPEGEDLTEANFDFWWERTIAGDASRCTTCDFSPLFAPRKR
jgi:hypothetical protein